MIEPAPVRGPTSPALPAASAGVPSRRSDLLLPARRVLGRLGNEWLPGVAWAAGKTGRTGLAGMALLVASAIFFASTHLQVENQVRELREQVVQATHQAATVAPRVEADPAAAVRKLRARSAMPTLHATLHTQADAAQLSIDTGKYETTATKTGSVVRYNVSFPVSGPYPDIRKFIDGTLAAMPAVAISSLRLERKAIGDGMVEAQLRLTVYTRATP